MPGRSFTSANYRYGFNRKENDPETNTQDYGMRIYKPALGKFLSVDPLTKTYPELTPYQFASNMPINSIDRDGEEAECAICDRAERAEDKYVKDVGMSKVEGDNWKREQKMARGLGGIIGGAIGGVPLIAEYFPVLAKLGYIGATVNVVISWGKGDNAYETVKSAFSGFYGGAVLGVGGQTASLLGLGGKGALSGLVGEATKEVFDNAFGKADGLNLKKLAANGAIGGIANVISSKLTDLVMSKIQQQVSQSIANTNTSAYRSAIQKEIRAQSPGIGNAALKKAVNARIDEIQRLTTRQGEGLKAAVQQAISRGTDILSDKASDAANKSADAVK